MTSISNQKQYQKSKVQNQTFNSASGMTSLGQIISSIKPTSKTNLKEQIFQPVDISEVYKDTDRSVIGKAARMDQRGFRRESIKTLLNKEKNENRKYTIKLHDDKKEVYDDTYQKLIPEKSQFEHVKSKFDLCQDIFVHTDAKIKQNTEKIVDYFNQNNGCYVGDNVTVKEILESDISFGLNANIERINILKPMNYDQQFRESQYDIEYRSRHELNTDLLSDIKFAQTLKKTADLARSKNSFLVYKKTPSNRVADFIIAKDEKLKKNTTQMLEIGKQIEQEEMLEKAVKKTIRHKTVLKNVFQQSEEFLDSDQDSFMNRKIKHDRQKQYTSQEIYDVKSNRLVPSQLKTKTSQSQLRCTTQSEESERGLHRIISTIDEINSKKKKKTSFNPFQTQTNYEKPELKFSILTDNSQTDLTKDTLTFKKYSRQRNVSQPKIDMTDFKMSQRISLKFLTQMQVSPENKCKQIVSNDYVKRFSQNPSVISSSVSIPKQKIKQLPSVQNRQKTPSDYQKFLQTPTVKHQEIQQWISKYPPLKTTKDISSYKKQDDQIKNIVQKASMILKYNSSDADLKLLDLKRVAEAHRFKMNQQTIENFEDLNLVNDKRLKTLYNYNLECQRVQKISQYEQKMEFLMGKGHPSPQVQRLEKIIEGTLRLGNKIKQKKNKKQEQIMHAVKKNKLV